MKNGADGQVRCVRWNGWLTPAQVAWLDRRAAAQPYRTSSAAVLRAIIDKAMKADKRKRMSG